MLFSVLLCTVLFSGVISAPQRRQTQPVFNLFFGTAAPTPQAPSNNGNPDPNCKDKLDNCVQFGQTSCQGQYLEWAKDYCPAYCGICTPVPTAPKPCVDKLSDCRSYGQQVCSDPKYEPWVNENCRYFCKKCGAGVTYTTTTIAPENCVDKLECKNYGKTACTQYENWARDNCMNYCGFCIGKPTPPVPCVDKIKNCDRYDPSSCTNEKYRPWAEENCRQHCKICTGGLSFIPSLTNAVVRPTLAPSNVLSPTLPYKVPTPGSGGNAEDNSNLLTFVHMQFYVQKKAS